MEKPLLCIAFFRAQQFSDKAHILGSSLRRVKSLAVQDFASFVFIGVHMINNDEKANQVPVFILQDEQAFIIII